MTTWVLLRGLARESRHWGGFLSRLQSALPHGERVIAPDLPGNGAMHRLRSPASVRGMAAHLACTLPASAPAPHVLVGLSLGGMVALQYAAEWPAQVAGCALINTSLGRFSAPWRRLRPAAWWPLAALAMPGMGALERERRVLALTTARAGIRSPETAAAWAGYATQFPTARANGLRQLWAAAAFRGPVRAPPVPLLLLASHADRLVDPTCSQAVAKAWRVPLVLHPAAGHDLPLDDPAWVIERLLAWRAMLNL